MRIFKSKIIICNSESFESEIIIYENEDNYMRTKIIIYERIKKYENEMITYENRNK